MGSAQASEIDAWVRAGGVVVAASERARRALLAQYHRARRGEGLSAWNTPPIYDVAGFVREQWDRCADGRLVLNALQEEAIWRGIIAEQNPTAALLRAPLRRFAAMAMKAHELLCAYAPRFLEPRARNGWRQDAEAFSGWLAAFEEQCRSGALLSAARLPLELAERLKSESVERAPLMLVGFDRRMPAQDRLFEAWGTWRRLENGPRATEMHSHAALDLNAELEACATWCRRRMEAQPDARILVITQDAARRRGEIERAFLRHANAEPSFRFEFSLGVPLESVSVVRSAALVLRWLSGPLDEFEIDWLFSNSFATAGPREAAGLQAFLRELRRRNLQQMSWTLDALCARQPRVRVALPGDWVARMTAAQQRLAAARQRTGGALEWAALAADLLKAVGWPGYRQPGSIEFQAAQRFEGVLDACASLGFHGREVEWPDFLAELSDALAETLFAPESEDAPILIAGPAESAGLTADAIWFLGAHEDAWPGRGSMHPLLPAEVQRNAGMPHASAQSDYDLAQTITERLAASAEEICFSYPRLDGDVETRESRLVAAVAPTPISVAASARDAAEPGTVQVEDAPANAIAPGAVRGGAALLTAQSQCGFRGFATARLEAEMWEAAEPGLTPMERGQLLHEVLHSVWAGQPSGLLNRDDLRAVADLRAFVRGHVERAIDDPKFRALRDEKPARFIALEGERLTQVVTRWLEYERERMPFEVAETEFATTANVEGLSFQVRLDRVDKLADGRMFVIDYKTGNVTPKAWELPRPDDVQLPLYAGFAVPQDWDVAGLAFAKIRAGEVCFSGCVKDAESAIGRVQNIGSLKNNSLREDTLDAWREAIERLARDFLAGRADVDPREPEQTCKRCGLQTVCRIHEQPDTTEDEASEEDGDGE